jgi:hypothetical protein
MISRKNSGSSPSSSLFSSSVAGLLALAIATCAVSGTASAHDASHLRGDVLTRGPAAKVVAVGPIALHAYSEFAGGTLFSAPAVTGTDRDCALALASQQAGARIPADKITSFTVPQGQVVCLATATKGSFELLWHAVQN